jgi:hypothetical protein
MLLLAPIDLSDDQRKETRVQVADILFITAVFKLGDGLGNQDYELSVINYSRHGLGLLISEKEYPLVHILRPGQEIKGIRLFAEAALTIVDAKVRHITRLEEGEQAGQYLLGLESANALAFEPWGLEN